MRNPPRLRTSALLAVLVVATLLATASPASAAATYAGTLAGPSVAATYPSGFEYDDVNDRLVLADTGLDRIEFYRYTIGGTPASSTFTKLAGQFGTHGTGNGQFDSPRDVAVDGAGNLYVADAGNNRVQSFTSTGVFRWAKGGTGTCNDCLNTPIGVTWDAANDVLLVASTGQDKVKAFSGTGVYQWSTTPGTASGQVDIDAPRDVARGPDGRLWVADYHHHLVKAFNVTGAGVWQDADGNAANGISPVFSLGGNGTALGQLNFPYNMDWSLDGQTLYVSDTGNNRIARWNVAGATPQPLSQIGGKCSAAPDPCPDPPADLGTIDTLRRVAVDPAGRLLTADFWGNGVQVWNADGTPAAQIELISPNPSGFAQAFGVATAPDGKVYAMDRLNQHVEYYSAAGAFLGYGGSRGTAPGRFSWPEAVAVAGDGTVFAADTRGDRIQKWPATLSGTVPSYGSSGSGTQNLNYVEDLDVGPDGLVYVADTRNDRIQVLNPALTSNHFVSRFGTAGAADGQLQNPQGVVATSESGTVYVYVADTDNNRVVKFTAAGTFVAKTAAGLALSGPQGIAVDPDGTIWVADTKNDRIVHLSPTLQDLGHTFGATGSGNLQFNLPHTLDVAGDTLYVADTFNDRVQRFDISSLGGGGTDLNAPDATVTVPTANQTLTGIPATLSGNATDDVSVAEVRVAIKDRTTSLWYRSNGTWGAFQNQQAALGSPGATSTSWSYVFTPAAGGSGNYSLQVTAVDGTAKTDPTKPNVAFQLTAGGGGGFTPAFSGHVGVAGGVAPLYPAGAVTAPDGTRYVADSGGSRLVRIAANGTQTELSPRSAGWNDPRGVELDAVDPSALWIADTSDSQIVKVSTGGQIQATFGGAGVLNQPYGLANDANGVYVADTYNNRVVKLSRTTGAVQWTAATCNGTTFSRPRDITVGSNGDLYVADTDRNRIVRLTTAGACVSSFGTGGTGNGQFRGPRAIVSDGAGGLWITEGTGNRLQHVGNAGAYIAKIGSFGEGDAQFRSAHCVFMDGAAVAVCDTFNYRIQRFAVDANGVPTYQSTLGGTRPTDGGFNGAFDVAYGPDGSLYATDWFNHRILKFDPSGAFVAAWGGYGPPNGSFIFPRGIAVTAAGTVVVTDSENNRIDLLSSTGAFQSSIKPSTGTKFLRPHQTAVGPDGTYWVADTGNNRIVNINASGTVLRSWNNAATVKAPRGIAVDPSGNVYVANTGNNRVEKYSPDGTRLSIVASNGTGNGQVKAPYGLRIVGSGSDAKLMIADRGNNRIVVYTLAGSYLTSFGTAGSGNGQLTQPQGIDMSPVDGDLAVADFANNRLSIWTSA